MADSITQLKPEILWKHFNDLCQIPRPSKHEERVAQHLRDFGKKHGIETVVDPIGNVIFKKPATPGMENHATVVLQAHMDMVPQKNQDTQHDFLKDPIRPRIDGELVRATGTTLGADNGIGVAAILAVFESKDVAHGPIEALITIDEEAGMTGAKNVQPGILKANYMINLDSEDEHELCVGCAGGVDTNITFPTPRENLGNGYVGFDLFLAGFRGGHSGVDIALGRGNATLQLTRLLFETLDEFQVRLAQLDGGDLRNVIPREARAVIAVPSAKGADFQKRIARQVETLQQEFAATDPEVRIDCKQITAPSQVIRQDEARRLISALFSCPNGPFYMTPGMPDLAETSSNIGVVKTEQDHVSIRSLQRSSIDSRKYEVAYRIRSLFELAGAQVVHNNPYSGWNPNMKSPLLATMSEVYERTYGKKAEIKATHGGLECGIIMGAYPALDAVSCGPTIRFPHSPDEHVDIASVKRFWDYLVTVLKEIPKA